MKGDRQKLRQWLTNLAAILARLSDTRKAGKKQIQQLGAAIIDHGRMLSQFYSHQPVGVEVKELAFRFRETTHNIVTALVLLEKEGWARRTGLAGYWTLCAQPQNNNNKNNKEVCSPAMKDQRRV